MKYGQILGLIRPLIKNSIVLNILIWMNHWISHHNTKRTLAPGTTLVPTTCTNAEIIDGICGDINGIWFRGARTHPNDTYYYSFKLKRPSRIIIDACDSEFNTGLYLYSSNGTETRSCDDSCGCVVETRSKISITKQQPRLQSFLHHPRTDDFS